MTRRPDNNLPAPSQPWARSVETDLRNMSFDADKNSQDTRNAFESINASLIALGNQVSTLNGVVNALPIPVTDWTRRTNFAVPDGISTLVTLTLPKPEGKTSVALSATIQGFYIADFNVPRSDVPVFAVSVETSEGILQSPFAVMVPDNMDSYHVIGFSTVSSTLTTTDVTIKIVAEAGPATSSAYVENELILNVLAVFS